MPVRCDAAGSFYGFGEQYNATDQRGGRFPLLVGEQGIGRDPALPYGILNGGPHTTYFPMPYWLDARGHGGLFLTDHRVEVDVCATNPAAATFEVVDDAPVELVLFHGPTPLDVVRVLGDEVGRPRQPPAWASDVWIASQGGTAQVLADADALEALGIPAGVLWVQDWTGIRQNFDGGFGVQYRWEADETLYPNLAGTIADLGTRGYRFLSYVNPFVATNLQHFAPMSAAGWLIENPAGQDYVHLAPNGTSSHPDLSVPAAREFVKGFFRDMVNVYGMDGWMADFGEWAPLDARYADGREGVAAHNRYPIDWHALSTEVMDELRPGGDWVVFTRSGWTGDQAVTQIHWVGDQEANWSPYDGLSTVVPAMLNLGISGVPYVTHDIAGFSGGPSTKELYLRWTELGAFTPYMRTHQGGKKLLNWSWKSDAETSAHFARFARIHRALAPELQALAAAAATTSAPIVRHLMLADPDDPGSRGVSDEYLLGDAMLVAPVVVQGATTRDVYLPPGTWYHVWTGTAYTGPATITVPAPIGSPPVFSRDVDRPDLRAIM
jgi:alpha-glucosidase